ncbi:MAG: hypothetical protein KJO31_07870 [Gammaproteobacteria bacterium]|nr:hypothetical protein [Gammaproteobacteria bacterium]
MDEQMRLGMTLRSILPFAALAAFSFGALADENSGDGVTPDGFVRWNSDYIEEVADSLEQRLGDELLVWETVGNYDGHSIYLVLRGRTDRPEMHETESDVQIGVRGTALSVVGGEMVDAVSMPRKQQRGSSIVGGLRKQTGPGDLIHIPPGVPHQLIIEPGEPYMYLLFKLDEEPLQ